MHDCAPGSRFLFVDEDGRVSPCNYAVPELGIPIASLTSWSDLGALGPRFTAAVQSQRPEGALNAALIAHWHQLRAVRPHPCKDSTANVLKVASSLTGSCTLVCALFVPRLIVLVCRHALQIHHETMLYVKFRHMNTQRMHIALSTPHTL